MKYKKTILPNGLRIITVPTKGNPSATVLVMAEVGSKYETKSESGLSHFIEHMAFKGTKKRPSSIIVNKELDSLGASSNAMTSEEYTGYYAKSEKKNWKKLLDVLSDIYIHPNYPEAELEKERGVITQEISMYEDLPQYKVGILFHSLLYGDTPTGRFVAGTKESVAKLKHQNFIEYHKNHYVAGKTAVIVSGDISEAEIIKEVKRLFNDIPTTKKLGKEKVIEKQTKPEIKIINKKSDQTHMILGVRTFGTKDKRNPTLDVLSGVLGAGMSSRLWHKLREELAACYYVNAGADEFTDHGYFAISTGVENSRVAEITKVLLDECKKLTTELVTQEELKRVKDYLVGQMYLKLETTNSLAMFYGFQEIMKGKSETPMQIEKEIRAVSPKGIMKLAKEIFQNKNLNLAVVGDIKDEKSLKKVLLWGK
jgi:predicted Zn-dependent peptidase